MSPVGWIVTPGEAGFESQGRGLAEALGLEPVFKRVRAEWPWQRLPGRFWLNPLARLAEGSERLDPPWPDVVVVIGAAVVPAFALAIGKHADRQQVWRLEETHAIGGSETRSGVQLLGDVTQACGVDAGVQGRLLVGDSEDLDAE